MSPIYDLPYTDVAGDCPPGSAPLPLADGVGSAYVERESEIPGRIALLRGAFAVPGDDATTVPWALVIEHGEDLALACPLSNGQLHRLTNALDGRGTRGGIRPRATTGAYVHLAGTPERLTVDLGDDERLEIPAGPRRALAKALRAASTPAA